MRKQTGAALVLWFALLLSSSARASTCEQFGSRDAPLTVVFFHGASGADAYRTTAQQWAQRGYFVLYPHYLLASKAESPTDAHYAAWVAATAACIAESATGGKPVVLFGISLGASVALAAGTQLEGIDSIVDWSGSLPDTYFYHLRRLPPLLILHGADDTSVPAINAQQLFTLCSKLHVDCTGTLYKGDGHVFPYHRDDAKARTQAFLQSRIPGH